jgi:hypothetical protein
MKCLTANEVSAVSGGQRNWAAWFSARGAQRIEPADPAEIVATMAAPADHSKPARIFDEAMPSFATAIPIAGFVTANWMTGEPVRGFPVIGEPIALADADDSVATADAAVGAQSAPSSADSVGGGGDAGASAGCSSGDSGGCGW